MRLLKRGGLLLAAISLLSVITAQALNVRFTLGVNPDGTRSTAYKCVLVDRSDCAPPTTATLTYSASAASLPSLLNLPNGGGSYSENSRAHFSGSAAATCTLSVVAVSGPTGGWTYSGDNLTNPVTSNNSGVLKEGCTTSGNTVYGPDRAWSIITAPGTDVTAPTIPTGLAMTAGASSCQFDFDASSDPYVTTAGSGLDQYDLRCGSSIVHTITGAAHGISQAYTLTNIGSSTPSPAGIQTGNSWALTAGGAGFHGTINQWPVWTTSATGDITLTAQVSNFTSVVSSFSSAGLIAMESAASGSKLFACYVQRSDNSVQCKSRTSTGGSSANIATILGIPAGNVWLQIKRTGDIWIGRYSLDGNTWLAIVDSNYSLPMSSGVQAGFFAHSHVNGSSITATISEVNLTAASRPSYSYSTASACSASVRARDVSGNNSAYSPAVLCTPTAPPAAAKKWHPGYYMLTSANEAPTSQFDSITGKADWIGAQQRYYWASLEPTQDNYDFSKIDSDAAYLSARGKRLVVQIEDRVFGSSNWTGKLPGYLNTAGCIYVSSSPVRVLTKIWLQSCMDRYIALFNALAAHVESMSNVEMVTTEEVTPGITPPVSAAGYDSRAQLSTQWQRWAAAVAPNYLKTNLCHYTNSLSGEIQNIAEVDYANKIGLGGPDTIPNQTLQGDQIIQGISPAVRDYRGTVPVCYAVQVPELGGKEGNFTPAQFVTFANGTLHMSHMFFVRQLTAQGGTGTTWTDFDNYITGGAHPLTSTACPSQYTGGCDTSVGGSTQFGNILYNIDYTGGTLGATGPSANGYYAAQSGSTYDNTHLDTGKTRSLKQTATNGIDDPTVGTSYTLSQKLAKGDEFWHSVRVYFPAGYSFAASPHLKWFRYRTETPAGANKGYADIYFDPNGSGAPANTWKFIKEQVDVWNYFDQSNGAHAPILNSWHTYDYYVKFDNGTGRVRFWIDKVLIGDIAVQTLTDATDLVINALTWTYWNGGAPQTQNLWVGQEAYAIKCATCGRDDTSQLAQDAAGNRLIAVGY